MKLLNCCPRLTHLSLTGVAAFQRDDFQPFCRQAPAGTLIWIAKGSLLTLVEFTQHQRDVFCVFSGNMVSQFRHYLNTDPQFEELRENFPGVSRRRGGTPRRNHTPNGILADAEGMDDEMGEEDNDFEGMDASQLSVNGQAHQLPAMINGNTQAPFANGIAVPPPPPLVHQTHLSTMFNTQPPQPSYLQDHNNLGPLSFSSFLNNQPANGAPPLSTHGYSQASMASVGNSTQAGPSNARQPNGASTASMHQPPEHNGDNDHFQTD